MVNINTDRMGQPDHFVINLYIPASHVQSMTFYIENEDLSQTPEICFTLFLKTAEMLKIVHDNNFELGEIKVSNLFVEATDGVVTKVYPISLKKLRNHRSSQSSHDMPSEREEDVYFYGHFMIEVYHLVDRYHNLEPVYHRLTDLLGTHNGHRVSSIYPDSIRHLMDKCLRKMPQDRPDRQEIIRDLSYEISTVTSRFASTSSTMSSNSSSALSYLSTSEPYAQTKVFHAHCVLNPSDDESCANEETFVKRPIHREANEYSKLRDVSSADVQTKSLLRFRNLFKKKKKRHCYEPVLSATISRHCYEPVLSATISLAADSRFSANQRGNYSRPLPPLPLASIIQQEHGHVGEGMTEVQIAMESEDNDDISNVRDWNVDRLAELAYMMDDLFLYSVSSEQSQEPGINQYSNYDALDLGDPSLGTDENHDYCNLRYGEADAYPEISTHLAAPPDSPRRTVNGPPLTPSVFSDPCATSQKYIDIEEKSDCGTSDGTNDNPRHTNSAGLLDSAGDDTRGTNVTVYATLMSIENTFPKYTSVNPTISTVDNDYSEVYV